MPTKLLLPTHPQMFGPSYGPGLHKPVGSSSAGVATAHLDFGLISKLYLNQGEQILPTTLILPPPLPPDF